MTLITEKLACIFGGTGFIGRQIVRQLAKNNYRVKIATRVPERGFFLKTAGQPGQIVPVACLYGDDASLREAIRGCDLVINCVGILAEKGKARFDTVHSELPRRIARLCAEQGVERLIHLSALGCDQASSKYAKSKLAGEAAVRQEFPAATIFRPSVVFGPEDNFFNMFARLSVLLPALPLIGGGETKLQPVYVGDLAAAVSACVIDPTTAGKTYELGGPQRYSFREIYQMIFRETGRRRVLMSVPWGLAKMQGTALGLLPKPPLTADQVETLKTDNVVAPTALGFRDLGIVPTAAELIVPSYLARFRPGGRFGDKKRA